MTNAALFLNNRFNWGDVTVKNTIIFTVSYALYASPLEKERNFNKNDLLV